ncbi:MAG: potassium-transporting ATPase subunit C, partial [Microbacterium sp.]
MSILTLAGFGFLYSLAGVGIGQALFQDASNGSLVERNGRVVGSALVAQPFIGDRYFQPRPSAANYNPMALAGSNQARTNPDLRKRLEDARAAIARREGVE